MVVKLAVYILAGLAIVWGSFDITTSEQPPPSSDVRVAR